MSNTIELLNAVGQNAALRHAPAEELARALGQAGASEALQAAAKSGDSSGLTEELGQQQPLRVDQHPHITGHEEDEEPGRDDDDSSRSPPPGPDEPSPGQ